MTTALWAAGLVILGTFIGAGGPILFKKGSATFSLDPRKILKNPLILFRNYYVLLGCLLYSISSFIFIPALRGGELSVLYPLVSLSYIWVSLLSVKFLGERMNLTKITGIALIIIGVSLIGIGST
ncbi:MAG: EamA family transporter [Candidatus Woesearchaeota archaeon]